MDSEEEQAEGTINGSEVPSPQTDQSQPPETVQSPSTQELTFRVPASIANFGPGLETVALAVKLYLKATFRVQAPRKSQGIEIICHGAIAEQLPTDNSNLIAKVIEQVWPQDPRLLSCLSVTIESDIPFAAGLGSSAAATAAGVSGALALSGVQLEKGLIFDHTARIEGHADSASASVFGGFTICAPNIVPGDFLPRRLIWPDKWCLIAAIPEYKVSAKKGRAALPASVSYKDAIYSVQRAALLIEAIAAGDDEALKAALRDKLHEPYRGKLVPELAELKKLTQGTDAIGTVLSGNGPAMITVVDRERKELVLEQLQSWTKSQKKPCQIKELEVDEAGLMMDN